MTLTNTANLDCSIDFTALETNSLSRISDIGSVGASVSLSQGTGTEQIDCCWHDVRTASGNSSDFLDLSSLRFTLFDQEGTVSFNKIRGIIVKNQSESSGDIITIAATGSNAFTRPFNGGSGNQPVYAKSAANFYNPIEGWTVDSTHKYLSIRNETVSGINYEIAIVGVTG